MHKIEARESAQAVFHCSIEKGHGFEVSQNVVDEQGREFRVRHVVHSSDTHDLVVIAQQHTPRPARLAALADLPDWDNPMPRELVMTSPQIDMTAIQSEADALYESGACLRCNGSGDYEADAPGSLHGVEAHECSECYGTGRADASRPMP